VQSRRNFLKSLTALGVAGATSTPSSSASSASSTVTQAPTAVVSATNDRVYWLDVLEKIASPVLDNLARRELRKNMPVEDPNGAHRVYCTHLEAFGRTLTGIAPWLVAPSIDAPEAARQKHFVALVQESLDAGTDPRSPDFLNFHEGRQPLVDTAFMAQGILRAPAALWQPLDARVRRQIIDALVSSRAIATPTANNWVLFAAMIEAALQTFGEKPLEGRLENCVNLMLGWYKGDSVYGDGAFFHSDYYDSFVIHPMLVDVLAVLKQNDSRFGSAYGIELARAKRYAEILERLIAPDGSFPSLGRSTTYRFGAFHALAQIAWMRELPAAVKPAQARSGMTAVIRKTIEAPRTFDDHGWLQIGFCGHQPALAESYISTGSLYLCCAAFLPLGLPPSDEFWSAPPAPWTSQLLWSGQPLPRDHAMAEEPLPWIPSS
jgi:hypothetical protein